MKEYFSFTKRERYGVFALLVVMALVIFLPQLMPTQKPKPLPANVVRQLSPTGSPDTPRGYSRPYYYQSERDGYRYRVRDSLDQKTYRWEPRYPARQAESGRDSRRSWQERSPTRGRYNSTGYDGQRWGSTDQRRDRPETFRKQGQYSGYRSQESNLYGGAWRPPVSRNSQDHGYAGAPSTYRRPRYDMVDINIADTTAFIALPGIGSKLAARIVSFREKLGGFDGVEQIRNVYGLKDSVFLRLRPYLKCDSAYIGRRSLSYQAGR